MGALRAGSDGGADEGNTFPKKNHIYANIKNR